MNDDGENDDDDHKTGYKIPPKETQFKKGQSGNPSGRPKESISFEKAIVELLNGNMSLLKTKSKEMTGFDFMQRLIITKALSGDRYYVEMLLKIVKDYYAKNKPAGERRPPTVVILPAKDIDKDKDK